jgi:hypothetical protein
MSLSGLLRNEGLAVQHDILEIAQSRPKYDIRRHSNVLKKGQCDSKLTSVEGLVPIGSAYFGRIPRATRQRWVDFQDLRQLLFH